MKNQEKEREELFLVGMTLASILSIGLLFVMFWTFPRYAGVFWMFLILLQIISSYCGYRLCKEYVDFKKLLDYLKSTKV